MLVAGILLNYNSRSEIKQLARSLEHQELITPFIVDNSSDALLKSWCENNNYTYIDSKGNIGYAGGNNLGLKEAKIYGYKYGFILNPDVTILSLDVHSMSTILAEGKASIIFPVVYNSEGGLQNKVPTLENRILRSTGILPSLPEDGEEVIYVDHGPGSAMLVDLDILDDLGYLDEHFFLYGEEVEFCYRARRAGYNIAIHTESQVIHTNPISVISDYEIYYQVRNKFLQLNIMNYSPIYLLILIVFLMGKLYIIIKSRELGLLRPFTYGILDGLRLKTGKCRY